jgi:hypothetical protein
MIIHIPCQGGLGNQLFIWSAAHRIATNFNCPVKICYLDHKKSIEQRELFPLIQHCDHDITISNSLVFGKTLNWFDIIQNITHKFESNVALKYLMNDHKNPHSAPTEIRNKSVITRGYFQNNELVAMVMDQIAPELEAQLNKQVKKIDMKPQVAVHVRRGDYLKAANFYGVLTRQYYSNILHGDQKYVLFVEDRQQVKDFESDPNLINVIDRKDANAWETLAMFVDSDQLHMSNSTLSWWGAKLSENRKKLITMPFPWHKQGHNFQENLISTKFKIIESEFERYDN